MLTNGEAQANKQSIYLNINESSIGPSRDSKLRSLHVQIRVRPIDLKLNET